MFEKLNARVGTGEVRFKPQGVSSALFTGPFLIGSTLFSFQDHEIRVYRGIGIGYLLKFQISLVVYVYNIIK